ncbi:MAG TPA: Gfo/Idh/MocA family oxidoreductase [Actinomycetota bacterium]|nr:Gfo/Idh/MocA family oxidoreductase [Actinomycetota bacterium]
MRVLRWGVLSTARIGREKVIPGIRSAERCEVVAIASRDGDRARSVAAELGIPRVHGSYEALLEDPEVEAVYIPLPNHLHAEWTIAAAQAGKHVLCEKPIAMSSADAEEMAHVCATEGVRLMEAFMYRLHPSWVAVRELVGSGRIGQLRAVQSWFSYFNDEPTDIRNIREVGGGALMDIGCYPINVSRMLFGEEPTRVEASITRDPASGVDVITSALLEFGDRIATFTCTTRAEPDQRVHIYGTEGRVSVGIPFNIPPDRPTEVFFTAGGDPPVAPDTEVLTFDPADQYAVQAQAFATAVLDDVPVPLPPEDSVANMRVIEAVFAAGGRARG